MERAYLITENTNLSALEDRISEYDRLYFWDAYCEHNLFAMIEDASFIDKIRSFRKPLTFTTPIVSDKNIDRLIDFIDRFSITEKFEVVVNDYGVLRCLEGKTNIRLAWGNFLSWQNKDPFLKIFKDKEIHKHWSIDNGFYVDYLRGRHIDLVEAYNVFQGIRLDGPFDLTLYYPYVVYSINRYCPTKLARDGKDFLTVVTDCGGCKGKNPQDFNMDLKMKTESSKNYFRGNKQFYKNDEIIENEKIKRIVYNYDLVW